MTCSSVYRLPFMSRPPVDQSNGKSLNCLGKPVRAKADNPYRVPCAWTYHSCRDEPDEEQNRRLGAMGGRDRLGAGDATL